jgi:hypothetical protein
MQEYAYEESAYFVVAFSDFLVNLLDVTGFKSLTVW